MKKKLSFVMIEGIDHSVSLGGEQEVADVYPMKAAGWLRKETKEGYHLTPMMFDNDLNDPHNVTLFIAKTRGMKIRRIK